MSTAKRLFRSATIAITVATIAGPAIAQSYTDAFRPPAVPLVTSDPNLSIWSKADRLTDDVTRHWTGRPHSLVSLIRVDGKCYRLMGMEPAGTPAMPQRSVTVTPTQSIYRFANGSVRVKLTFTTPLLPDDLDVFARPVTYLTWSVQSADGTPHAVTLYDSTSSALSVNEPDEKVTWARDTANGLIAMHAGTADQPILTSGGDDHRIDWGYAYAAAPANSVTETAMGGNPEMLKSFVDTGRLPSNDDTGMPRAVNNDQPVMAFAFDLGNVGEQPVNRHVMVAYDEIFSIDYFHKKLRPYWRRNGEDAMRMLADAERDYPKLLDRCNDFDANLTADLTKVGGPRYAQIAALAYREAIAACGLAADSHGQPLLFTKENTSNGDIATVDVIFPMDPIFVFLCPSLAKASLVPDLSYASSDHWKFPNAPHDLGTYPLAYGTDDGGEGMPVEESGNMIILCDAIAKDDGNADFVKPWWPKITQWAKYLEQYGLDPEDQLCTDDFMGHLAHNANLSIKAILALAAYGDLCRMRGDTVDADRYRQLAKTDAAHWVSVADAGDRSLLAFDKPDTWSQKYNLVWDRILGLNVFPQSVADKEIAFYKSVMQPYGLPLDSRTHLTKSDWTVWSATLASNNSDFERIISPLYDYLNVTSAREPFADSYMTDDMHSGGMHARPVVGGVFIKMLSDPAIWMKWAHRDTLKPSGWAPLPPRPVVTEVVPTSKDTPQTWRFTLDKPADDWAQPGFDDAGWATGTGGFGTNETPGAVVNTTWNTSDIWLRRTFTMPNVAVDDLRVYMYHDDDVEVYLNGKLAVSRSGWITSYQPFDINPEAKAVLVPGKPVVMAVHCHQNGGGQDIDAGLATVTFPGL